MNQKTENGFFIKLSLIGAIVLLVVTAYVRHNVETHVEEFNTKIEKEIETNLQQHIDELTTQF
ncbi:hypothetical protein JMA_38990 (plasmid) [Jeotgalibacillus malaysiensis]|uniref:Uncharacterized protein n=1 Tax=Jeotgalibacillus malaysiensis TaxID=1508404 RepID=A0A0B5AX02_9BACL|nr:hypothetical protein [Jeotgalibacillus malaysiensis]AJD93217.1 hypothetical protein JMA_38990 [Jeotgalibacillus malaysiensis]